MPYTLNILEVKDFGKWKSDWDSSVDMRRAGGQGAFQIFRTKDDPSKVVLFIEWNSLDNARKFMQSKELREALKQSGVIELGDTYFLEQVEKGSV